MRHGSVTAAAAAFAVVLAQAALSTASFAADVAAPPLKAAAPVSPPWAGFYVGVTGGYGWSRDHFINSIDFGPPIGSLTIDGVHAKGGVVGGYAGYNWQYGRFVAGLEIDFTATDISGTSTAGLTAVIPPSGGDPGGTATISESIGERVKYLGSARARLGWTPSDTLLVYGTAGLAWERIDQTLGAVITLQGPAPIISSTWQQTTADKFGWVAGVGTEVMLGSPNWIGRLEYLHYGMGRLQETSSDGNTQTAGSQNIDIVRAGLAYKFGGPQVWTSAYASAPVNAPSWSGFYIGAHGGYGWGRNPFTVPFSTSTPDIAYITGESLRGWLAGAQIGHNWQYGSFVAGLEFDLSAADIKGNSSTASISTGPGETQTGGLEDHVKYLGTVRGRLGWTPLGNLLLYGTGGLAWERLQRNVTDSRVDPTGTSVFQGTSYASHFGWAAGAGVEVMLGSPNWIGRVEYLHYDFGRLGDQFQIFIQQPALTLSISETAGRHTIDTVRAGVSYKFDPQIAAATSAPLYTKAPPLPVTLQNWAGFYIGAHVGYGWKRNDFSVSDINVPIGGIDSNGFIAGGQAGYNWQYRSVVAGIEVDGSATGIQGTAAPVQDANSFEVWSDKVKYLGTLRGRLGWTPLNNVLLYGTGGLAWERAQRTEIFNGEFSNDITNTPRDHFGWAAGAGAEFMLGSSNWIGRIEYLHYDFGQVEFSSTITSSVPGESSIDNGGRQTINVVRAGLSYKFTP